jgi:predicted enzyme related to lactoylglutathione lyase
LPLRLVSAPPAISASTSSIESSRACIASTRTSCGSLAWRPELIELQCSSYLALELGGRVDGGIVECGTRRPLWLPYVEVDQIDERTEHARQLGARVLVEPREGPAGWRSVVSEPEAGEIAFWQPKR